MRKELDDALCRRYPTLYQKRSNNESLMHYGFSCGDGWYHIIDVISHLLTEHNQDITASQIKEKFGKLRFSYAGAHDDYSRGVTTIAEQVSGITCEGCGATSQARRFGGYISTMCQVCAAHSNMSLDDDTESDELPMVDGLGLGWARLFTALESNIDFFMKHNDMPNTRLATTKVDGVLIVSVTGGNDQTRGMVDFINYYAARIDEETGEIKR
jgi:hypothetical protein